MNRPIPTHCPFWRTGPARAFLIIVAAVVLGVLTGCGKKTDNVSDGMNRYTDQATGCEYLGWHDAYGAALTPRMDRDGKQFCNGALVGAK